MIFVLISSNWNWSDGLVQNIV